MTNNICSGILDNLRELQDASDRGWLLSSDQLGLLLNIGKHHIKDGMERYGFVLRKRGKNGQLNGFIVEKMPLNS